jgi:hypothetical protein
MSQRHIVRIVLASACSAGLIAAWSGEAAAKGSRCVAAYKTGMPLKEAGHLIEARRALMGCVAKSCGAVLRRECKKELSQATRGIASVVPTVTDEAGATLSQVEVTMDGAVLASRLTGKPLFVDPGDHQFSFKSGSGAAASQNVSVAVGERNRPISVSLGAEKKAEAPVAVAVAAADPLAEVPAEAAQSRRAAVVSEAADDPRVSRRRELAPSSSGSSSRTGAYVLGGIGALGVGGYALLTYWGRQQNNELDRCTPNCPNKNVDHIKKLYLYSDISLGVGLAALVASTWLFVTSSPSSTKDVATGHKPYAFDLKATGSSAFATLSGAF